MLTGQGVLFYECDRHTQIQKRAVSVPATQTKGVKKATSGFEAAGKTDAVLQHVLTPGDAGNGPDEVTLIILEREDKKGRKVICAFATSIPVDVVCRFRRGQMAGAEAFVEQYQARWSIETWYRCIESMRPRTQQRSPYACCRYSCPSFCSTHGFWHRTCCKELILAKPIQR